MSGQHGFDFETGQPGQGIPPSASERKRLEWEALGFVPTPCGEPSGESCPQCHEPILIDDDFAAKFGEHVDCFGENDEGQNSDHSRD